MKKGLRPTIAAFAVAILMTALFTAVFAASIYALSSREGSPRYYERKNVWEGSELGPGSLGPEAQSRMREKYSVYGKTDTFIEDGRERTVLTLFTDEQAELLYSRREDGQRSGLRYDEILFLINDTVQSALSNGRVVTPGAESCGFPGHNGKLVFGWDFDSNAIVSDSELIKRYDENLKGLAELIVCRLSAFDAGFTLPGELEPTAKRFLLVDNGIETDLASYLGELKNEYENYTCGKAPEAPLIVYDPSNSEAHIRIIETDGTEAVLFPTRELSEARPVRRPQAAGAPEAEYGTVLALSSYPAWFGAFESGGFAVLESGENGDALHFYSAEGLELSMAGIEPGSRFGVALYGDTVYCIEKAGTPGASVRRFVPGGHELEPIPIMRETPSASVLESIWFVFDGASPRAIVSETRRNSQEVPVTNRYYLDLTTGHTEGLGRFGRNLGFGEEPAAVYGDSILVSAGGTNTHTVIVRRSGETTELPGLVCDRVPAASNRNFAAILQGNGFAAVVDIETGRVNYVKLATIREGEPLAISADGRTLCTCSVFDDGSPVQVFRLYDTATGLLKAEFSVPKALDPHFTGFPYVDQNHGALLIPVKNENGLYAAAVNLPE